jgi:hypothetical protein
MRKFLRTIRWKAILLPMLGGRGLEPLTSCV